VRFSLQDIRKSVQRRGGTLAVSLHFLRSGELQDEILCLLMYYERLLGEPQRAYSQDEARAIIGEYRMAHCLIATLSHWYSWQPRAWSDVVQERDGNAQLLALSSSAQLRLALYTFVQEHYAGFLSAEQRPVALQAFAAPYHITAEDLEYLLSLDSDEEALLTRVAEQAPTPEEVTALYNQWVFEAALFNASYVHFVIDCTAFGRLASSPSGSGSAAAASLTPPMGVGAVIKRLCYLARRLGVYYDLEYEQTTTTGPRPLLLHLTLYGPQEVTGAPQQYGLRLARLCRMLLGYAMTTAHTPAHGYATGSSDSESAAQSSAKRNTKKANLTGAIVEAEARVHFLQRAYLFTMDARLLQLLPAATEVRTVTGAGVVRETGLDGLDGTNQLFDSSIEQSFSEGFSALARDHAVDGWSLEREPEPLLLEKGIFIPDFALTRLTQHIYVEILGFWTPAYRERKLHRLQQLRGRDDLLLAIPVDAREAFAAIAQDFPIVYYKDQLALADLLQILRQRYDNFAARLAQIDPVQVRQLIEQRGLLPEAECADVLHCYRLTEVQQAAALICAPQDTTTDPVSVCAYVPGLGFYTYSWFQSLMSTFLTQLTTHMAQQTSPLLLPTALALLRRCGPALQSSADATLETLIGLCPELSIQRTSIFDATVTLTHAIDTDVLLSPAPQPEQSESSDAAVTARKNSPHKHRSAPKKRVQPPSEIVQGDLWHS
jgi:Uncharacterized conserved protein